ncbi:MAG TPA: DUF2975 domain-containing protein [Candidatus Dormibacteraeota bacterium]|nr:DUF2975 domain-containing protein [Candidatus Dormibacteraeota bacterium]
MASRTWVSNGARVPKGVLDVAWYVVLIGSVLAVGFLVAENARGARPYVDFPVAFTLHGAYAVTGTSDRASIVQAVGQLTIQPPAELAVVGLVFVLVGAAFILVVLHQLRSLVADAKTGSQFGTGSARRVRLIGIAIIVVEVIRALGVLAGSLWAQSHVSSPGLNFRAAFPINLEVVGLGILVVLLAEVLRHGSGLQADHDLTT